MKRRGLAVHWVFACIDLGFFAAYFPRIPGRYWQEWHAKDEYFIFVEWAALHLLIAAVWLVVAMSKAEFKRWIVGVLASSTTCMLTLVSYPRVTAWYCRNVSVPSTGEIAGVLQAHRSVLTSAAERFSGGGAGRDELVTDRPEDHAYKIRGVRVVPLTVDEELERAGVTMVYARPDRGWIWMTTWAAGQYLPHLEAGLVFHREGARPTLEDATAAAGSDLLSFTPLEDHWSVYAAWNVYR